MPHLSERSKKKGNNNNNNKKSFVVSGHSRSARITPHKIGEPNHVPWHYYIECKFVRNIGIYMCGGGALKIPAQSKTLSRSLPLYESIRAYIIIIYNIRSKQQLCVEVKMNFSLSDNTNRHHRYTTSTLGRATISNNNNNNIYTERFTVRCSCGEQSCTEMFQAHIIYLL